MKSENVAFCNFFFFLLVSSKGLTVRQCQLVVRENKATEVKADKTDID